MTQQMPNTMQDLWPEDIAVDVQKIIALVAFLKQQATMLGQRTKNIVVAKLREIFAQEETRNVINALLAQSEA